MAATCFCPCSQQLLRLLWSSLPAGCGRGPHPPGGWWLCVSAPHIGHAASRPHFSSTTQAPLVMQEAVQMQRLRHSAVVGFVGVGVRGRTGLLLLEYMEGRDLYT